MKRVLLLTLISVTACSPANAPDFTLGVSKQAVNLAVGASEVLDVTILPSNGFDQEVDLSLVKVTAPAGVTGGFSLSPTKTTSQLTLKADLSVAPGSYTLLVRASSLSSQPLKREQTITLNVPTPTTVTVMGTVKNAFGVPLENASVRIGGTATVTSATGGFTFTNVQPPYTVSVVQAGQTTEHSFEGITRADPSLLLFQATGGMPLQGSAMFSGTLNPGVGVVFPNPANTVAQVAFSAQTARLTQVSAPYVNIVGLLAAQGPSYSGLEAAWTGSSSVVGRIHALQWRHMAADPGRPEAFLAYGSQDAAPSNGQSLTKNIFMQAITSGALTANLTLPAGMTLNSRQLYLNLGPKSVFFIAQNTGSSPNISLITPSIGKTLSFAAAATGPDGRSSAMQISGLQASQVVDQALVTPPNPASPANNALDVPLAASLNWSKPTNSLSIVFVGAPGLPNRVIYTSAASTQPGFTAAKEYTWLVASVGPMVSMDEFAGDKWADGYPTFGWDIGFFTATSRVMKFKTL
jgi:hypothetical protein